MAQLVPDVRRVVFSSTGDLGRSVTIPTHRGPRFALSIVDGLFSVLFPSHCRFCQAPIASVSRVPVCAECLDAIRPLQSRVCGVCGERIFSPEYRVPSAERSSESERTICLACLQEHPPYQRAAAYGSYDAGLRELIHLLKYDGVRPAANLLGRMLAEVAADLAEAFSDDVPLVMPVPLHASKMRQRGFNQSELIGRALLKLRPAALEMKLNTTALVRNRATESQTGLTPPQRRENIRGAFKVVRRNEVSGRDILLIDDVFTTGTTASECARVLRRAGANRVFVATVARVLKPEMARLEIPCSAEPGEKIEDEHARVMAAHV
jgi:ComF family protein